MAASAGTVTLELDANSVKLLRELQKSQRATQTSAARMRQNFERAFKAVSVAAIAAAGTLAVISKRSIELADNIGKTADKVGVGVEAFQELRYASGRAGVAQGTLDQGLRQLSVRIGEAAAGSQTAAAGFAALGIAVRDSAGNVRKTEDVYRDLMDAIKGINDPAARLAALRAIDRALVEHVNFLSQGSEAYDALAERARNLGVVLDERLVRNAEAARDRMSDLQQVLQANIARAVTENADSIITLSNALLGFVDAVGKAIQGWKYWVAQQTGEFQNLEQINARIQQLVAENMKLRERLEKPTIIGPFTWNATETRKQIDENLAEIARLQEQAKSILVGQQSGPTPAMIILPDPDEVEAGLSQVEDAFAETRRAIADDFKELDRVFDDIWDFDERWEKARAASEKMRETTDEMLVIADEAARGMQRALADYLFDPFDKGLKGMLRGFAETMRRIVAEVVSNQILLSIFGGYAGTGGILGGIGDVVTGKRALGGPVTGGSTYLVGERGPELFVPRTSGQIVPNNAMGGVKVDIHNVDLRNVNDPGAFLALVPVISAQVEQSITFKQRRGIL